MPCVRWYIAPVRCASCGYTAPNAGNDNAKHQTLCLLVNLLALLDVRRSNPRLALCAVESYPMYPRSRDAALRSSIHSCMLRQLVHTLSRRPIPTHQAPDPRAPPFARQIVHTIRDDQTVVAIATPIVCFAVVVTVHSVRPQHQLKLLPVQCQRGIQTYSKNWQFQ
jgi:hypothetical protein